MVTSVGSILNQWASMDVFSYVIPFLLIFAVVFAIIQKTNILGDNKGVSIIIAGSVGLLSLQFDFVSTFFADIFPRFGVAIAVLVALVILIGFFYEGDIGEMKWVGWVLGIGVVVWAIISWDFIGAGGNNWAWWVEENFWYLVLLALVIVSVVVVVKGKPGDKKKD